MNADFTESLRRFVRNPIAMVISAILVVGIIVTIVALSYGKKPVTSLLGLQATSDFCTQNPGYDQWCDLVASSTTLQGLITTQTTVLAVPNTTFTSMDQTDAAFLQTRPDLVNEILKYNILSAAYGPTQIAKNQTLNTLQGETIDSVYTTDGSGAPVSLVLNGSTNSVNIVDTATVISGINFYPLSGVLVPNAVASLLPSGGGSGGGGGGGGGGGTGQTPTSNIYDYVAGQSALSKLKSYFDATPAKTHVQGTNAFTLLAPTDTAFNALPAAVVAYLTDPYNNADLDRVLRYHLVRRATDAVDLLSQGTLTSLYGASISVSGSPVVPSGSVPDITFTSDGGQYHAKITQHYDVAATNGEVQWIDAVLIPQAVMDKINANPVTNLNLYDTIAANSDLSTLKSLIDKTNLKATLSSTTKTYTMFTPTNDAFTAMNQGTLAKIMANTTLLTDLLNYHLVPDKNKLNTLPDNPTTVQGEQLTTKKTLDSNGNVLTMTVNGATVTSANNFATNGYIDKITGVLVPKSVTDALNTPPPTNNTTNNTTTNTPTVVPPKTTTTTPTKSSGGSQTPTTGAGETITITVAILLGLSGVTFYMMRVRKKKLHGHTPENKQ